MPRRRSPLGPLRAGRAATGLASNGRYATAIGPLDAASMLNSIAGRRMKNILTFSQQPTDTDPTTGDTEVFGPVRFYTSPGHVALVSHFATLPTRAAPGCAARWRFFDSSGALVQNEPYQRWQGSTSTTSNTPDDVGYLDSRITGLSPNTEYYAIIDRSTTRARLQSVTLYEDAVDHPELDTADPTADAIATPDFYRPGSEITDAAISDLWTTAHTKWKAGQQIASWVRPDFNAYAGIISGTFVNLFDTSYTAYNAAAPGLWTYPQYTGDYSSDSVRTELWVWATAGSNGEVRIEDSSGALVTITGISGSPAWYSGTFNLDATATSQKLDVLVRDSGGGANAIKVYSVCMFTRAT